MTLTERLRGGSVPLSILTPHEWICGVQYTIAAKLKAFVNDIAEVEEPQRALYVKEIIDGKETGRWKIDADEVEDTKGLKSALRKHEDENKRLKEQAERFRNVNPEEYERLRKDAEGREAREETIRREAEDRIRDSEEMHRVALTRKDGEITRLKSQRDGLFLDTQLMPVIAAEKGVPELLLPHLRERVKVVEKDGQLRLEILNPERNGKLLTKDAKEAGVVDLVAEFKDHRIFSRAFEGTGAGGSGSEGGNGTGGGGGGRKRDDGAPNPFKKEAWNKQKQLTLLNRDAKNRIIPDAAKEDAEALARSAGFESLDKAMAATRAIQ